MSNLSRRTLVTSAAALSAFAVPAFASTDNPDPTFALLEEHHRTYDEWSKAVAAADLPPVPRETPKVMVGHRRQFTFDELAERPDGSLVIRKNPVAKIVEVYASSEEEIRRLAGMEDLITDVSDREELVATKIAELDKEYKRARDAFYQTEGGKLEAVADRAADIEFGLRDKIIGTPPTTFRGIAALLAHIRKYPDLSDQFFGSEVTEHLAASLELAICAAAGLPAPDLDDEIFQHLGLKAWGPLTGTKHTYTGCGGIKVPTSLTAPVQSWGRFVLTEAGKPIDRIVADLPLSYRYYRCRWQDLRP